MRFFWEPQRAALSSFLISMYEPAGLWGAIAALSAILIFLGLRA